MSQVQAVVLAAGKGTRMKTRKPKVLHELCGRSMLQHVLETLRSCSINDPVVVISPELREHVEAAGIRFVVQEPQNGTGHAVQVALPKLNGDALLVLSADMPLVSVALIQSVLERQRSSAADLTLVTARVELPSSFGRVVRDGSMIRCIVEERDATPQQRTIDEVNAGIYCFKTSALRSAIAGLSADNAQHELYLTDCVATIAQTSGRIETIEAQDLRSVIGINTRVELARADAMLRERLLQEHMLAGVTIVDPATTYVDVGVKIGMDSTIHPHSYLSGRTIVGKNCVIGPNAIIGNAAIADGAHVLQSVVKDSIVGDGVTIGPFAHLRGNTIIEANAHVGNFVEMKNTRMGQDAKAGHLAYLGDAEIGERANIGAGTITCNYDGTRKNKTKIGADAFVGSNSSLVAPLTIGEGALTGAGAVVLRDVPDGERVAGNPAKPLNKKRVVGPS